MSNPDSIQQQITDAQHLLSSLIQDLEGAEVFIRSGSYGMTFDQVMASHASRILLSCGNALNLLRDGAFYDAAVICRSMIETLISLTYIDTQRDRHAAAYNFVIDGLSHQTQKFEKLKDYYQEDFQPSEEQNTNQKNWELYIESIDYETRFAQQIKYLAGLVENEFPRSFTFMADLPYSDLSLFVHPRAGGLGFFAPRPGEMYKISRPEAQVQSVLPLIFCLFSAAAVVVQLSVSWGLRTADRRGEVHDLMQRISQPSASSALFSAWCVPEYSWFPSELSEIAKRKQKQPPPSAKKKT